MKAVTIFSILFICVNFGISAQDFKQFIPKKEPFKIFEIPKFPTIILDNELRKTDVVYADLDNMPILKNKLFTDKMPIHKPDNTIKYSLLAIDPIKKVENQPEK